MTGHAAFRATSASFVTAALLLLGACAVPLGPGFQVEREQIELAFVPAVPAHLHVRASYRLKNIGKGDLSSLEMALPGEGTFGRQNVRAQVEGREVAVQPVGETGATFQVPFAPSWPQKRRRTLVVDYDLAPAPPGHAVVAVNEDSFHVRDAAAFPVLHHPKGFFGKETGARQVDLSVRVPADFRMFVAGQELGPRQGGETAYGLRIVPRNEEWFVVAGRYQAQQARASGDTVIFWTFAPLAHEPPQSVAARLGGTLQTYQTVFGSLWKHAPAVRVIETRARLTQRPAGGGDAAGVAVPAGALLNPQAFAMGVASEGFQDLVEHELAHTWFGLAVEPRPHTQTIVGEGLAEYAVSVAAEARGGEPARRARAALLLRWFDESRKLAADKPLLRLEPSDPYEQRVFGYSKGALFLLALEDKYGKEDVRRALAHMVRTLRGTHFGFAELRAALEQETGQPLGDFFRVWLDRTGIPDDVRARYEVKSEGRE